VYVLPQNDSMCVKVGKRVESGIWDRRLQLVRTMAQGVLPLLLTGSSGLKSIFVFIISTLSPELPFFHYMMNLAHPISQWSRLRMLSCVPTWMYNTFLREQELVCASDSIREKNNIHTW